MHELKEPKWPESRDSAAAYLAEKRRAKPAEAEQILIQAKACALALRRPPQLSSKQRARALRAARVVRGYLDGDPEAAAVIDALIAGWSRVAKPGAPLQAPALFCQIMRGWAEGALERALSVTEVMASAVATGLEPPGTYRKMLDAWRKYYREHAMLDAWRKYYRDRTAEGVWRDPTGQFYEDLKSALANRSDEDWIPKAVIRIEAGRLREQLERMMT
jgi:hypothetical protein